MLQRVPGPAWAGRPSKGDGLGPNQIVIGFPAQGARPCPRKPKGQGDGQLSPPTTAAIAGGKAGDDSGSGTSPCAGDGFVSQAAMALRL